MRYYTKVYFCEDVEKMYILPPLRHEMYSFAARYLIECEMATTQKSFCTPSTLLRGVTEEHYREVGAIIETAKAFARSMYQCIYVLDRFKNNFLYVSENMDFLFGLSAEEIQTTGYQALLDCIAEEEQHKVVEVAKKSFEFIESLPVAERTSYTATCDFHLAHGNTQRLVSHTLTPICLAPDGRVWLVLCTLALSARKMPGRIIMKKQGGETCYRYFLDARKWRCQPVTQLSKMESELLILSAQGYTMQEIAARLYKSVDTIKGYKRGLFVKLQVKNIQEALSYVTSYRLL